MQPSTNPAHEALRNSLAAMMAAFEKKQGKVKTAPPTRAKTKTAKDFTITPPSIMAKRKKKALQA